MKKILILILGLLVFPQLASAQSQRNPCYYTTTGVTSCQPVGTSVTGVGNGPLPVGGLANAAAPTFTEGKVGGLSFDLSGNLRVSSSGGGVATDVNLTKVGGSAVALGSAVSASSIPVVIASNQANVPVIIVPSSSSAIGITPVVSAAAEASHVLKAGAGNAYSIYATNLTATAGFLQVFNATSAPVDGAVTPIACAPLSGNGIASVQYAPGPPGVFSTGITAVVSSAATCFTKTTGVITAYISGSVQ